MIGNHKDTNKYPINLLIINYLYNFFRPYNYFLSIFKQLLNIFIKNWQNMLVIQKLLMSLTMEFHNIEKD